MAQDAPHWPLVSSCLSCPHSHANASGLSCTLAPTPLRRRYGDIYARSDGERLFALSLECIGGFMYAYIIGSLSAILTTQVTALAIACYRLLSPSIACDRLLSPAIACYRLLSHAIAGVLPLALGGIKTKHPQFVRCFDFNRLQPTSRRQPSPHLFSIHAVTHYTTHQPPTNHPSTSGARALVGPQLAGGGAAAGGSQRLYIQDGDPVRAGDAHAALLPALLRRALQRRGRGSDPQRSQHGTAPRGASQPKPRRNTKGWWCYFSAC